MKIALPTDDLITISESLVNANWFKVFEFQTEYITCEAVFKNPICEAGSVSMPGYLKQLEKLLYDCDALVLHQNDPIESKSFMHCSFKEVRSDEAIITNAAIDHNNRLVYYYSNRCCSP